MSQDEWAGDLARMIAGEVRRHRQRRGLSAQQLADACEEAGFPIARSVLANFENGRRPTVSVAEVVVLARVLRVPPILLLFPLGRTEMIEMAPGVDATVWDAFDWFVGSAPLYRREEGNPSSPRKLMGKDELVWREEVRPLDLLRQNQRYISERRLAVKLAAHQRQVAKEAETEGVRRARLEAAEANDKLAGHFEYEIARTRKELRRLGWTAIPPLPDELDHIDLLMDDETEEIE
ncbi:helix-turn-helix transcriptional regulator [Nonomuraea sp. NPDC005692]|uniref:helix-turn-helix transcriptional regulator n=1 Tax=Nonomuraea sp. NPDC005692 TaxID=3157168 RepID=UPI003402DC3D